MTFRKYRPSGLSESGAVPPLFIGCVLIGIATGAAEALFGHWVISLIVVFQVLIGFAVGYFASVRIEKGRIRAPLAAAAAGLLGGFAGQLAVHVVNYELFRSEVRASIVAENPEAAGEASEIIDQILVDKTGRGGFPGFLELQAQVGVSIKKAGSSTDKGIHLEGVGAYILWLLELLVAMGVAAWMAFDRASQPFCERCKRWFDTDLLISSGSADKKAWKAMLEAIDRSDFKAAVAARGEATEKAAHVLHLSRCSQCESHEPVLTLKVVTGLNKKPQTKVIRASLLRFDEAKALLEAIETANPKPVAAPNEAATPTGT
ncbi:MAG: hypothetical protein QM765_32675 [Myxococcales bacterium]